MPGSQDGNDDGELRITQEQFNKSVIDHMKQMSGLIGGFDDRIKGLELSNSKSQQSENPRLLRSGYSMQPPVGTDRQGKDFSAEYFEHDNLYVSPNQANLPNSPGGAHSMFDGTRSKKSDPEREQLQRERVHQLQSVREQELHEEQRQQLPSNQQHIPPRSQQYPPRSQQYPPHTQQYPSRPPHSYRATQSNLYHYLDDDICPPTNGPTERLQEEFNCIKESLTSIRLPPSLHFADSRQGLKRESQAAYNSIAKSAKYVETTLKILSQLHTGDPVVRDLIVTQVAHLKYLIEEQSALLVHGTFNDSTAKIYRTLQRHTTAFSDQESVDLLRSAVQLAAASDKADVQNRNRPNFSYNQNRNVSQQGRGNNDRGGFRGQRGRNRPNYSNWNQQQGDVDFPSRRPNASTNQDSNAS